MQKRKQKTLSKEGDKLFIVRHYILAKDAAEAIRKAPKAPIHDVWVDQDWRKGQTDNLAEAIGFQYEPREYNEGE